MLVATWGGHPSAVVLALAAVFLAGAVLAAVHHAEVVASHVGEPFGSLILALAVTVIEVGLIVTLMVSTDHANASLARDTVFAAVMITCNGVLGICLLSGALRRGTAEFNAEGSATALARCSPWPRSASCCRPSRPERGGSEFSPEQLAFAAVASLALYALFVFVQTARHRDFFLPDRGRTPTPTASTTPSATRRWRCTSLGAAARGAGGGRRAGEGRSAGIEDGVEALGAPQSAVGVVIALLVLSPETFAALRNARARNRMQTSFNLALGSAIASIGLTIPAIAVASIWIDGPLVLGLGSTQIVLLVITGLFGALTVLPAERRSRRAASPGPLRSVPVSRLFPLARQGLDGP